jgi:hypothetical protein
MNTISKDPDGIVLVCHDRPHVERVDTFDKNVGSRRTQAEQQCRFTHASSTAQDQCYNLSLRTTHSWHIRS